MINNIGKNDNNINVPWYRRTVNYNLANDIPKISNEKFNIELPKPEPWEIEQENPQTNEAWQEQEQTQPQTEQEKNRVNVPTQEIPSIPVGKKKSEEPDAIPEGVTVMDAIQATEDWNIAIKVGETIWDTWTPEQKTEFMLNVAEAMNADADKKKLRKGIDYAVSYDYKNFNMGEYYNGLVLQCGVAIAIFIIIIAMIIIPGPQPL